jgi:hypothetical protein
MMASLATCFHEAGHAVVGAHLGLRIWDVHVRRRMNYSRRDEYVCWVKGAVSFHHSSIADLMVGYEDWRDHIRQNLAGGVSEERYYIQYLHRRDPHVYYGTRNDHRRVDELFAHFRDGAFTIEQARAETAALVTDLWPRIEVVARALKAKHELDEADVVSLCGMGARIDTFTLTFKRVFGVTLPEWMEAHPLTTETD